MAELPSSDNDPRNRRDSGLRNHLAVIVALFAIAVVVAAWFWSRQQTQMDAGLGAEHGVMVVGAGTFVAALVAAIRSMSLSEMLELVWELFLGLLALIGEVLKGIWNWFRALLGLD